MLHRHFGIIVLFTLTFAGNAVAAMKDQDRVVVIRNEDSPISVAVANDYLHRRGLRNVVSVRCQDAAMSAERETISYALFQKAIETPLRAFLATHAGIDYIVLTKGVPLRITDAPGIGLEEKRPSLDSFLAALDYERDPKAIKIGMKDGGFHGTAYANRFWSAKEHFSHLKFGGYLVTRLDGYTLADALALTTRALQAQKQSNKGVILLDTCPDFGYADDAAQPLPLMVKMPTAQTPPVLADVEYKEWNADLVHSANQLQARNVPFELDKTAVFLGERSGLLGYASWGSNDRHFDTAAYHKLRFAPGAIGETAVSTSARTFLPTQGGQSLIADLVAQGITGVKGYCDEPLLIGVASPSILFDRYSRGWNLAESFYAASRMVGWEDIILGDPLCKAYQ